MNLITPLQSLKISYLSKSIVIASVALFSLSGCGSDSGSSSSKEGYINLYNVSANSPEIYLTIDEDIDKDEEDEVEVTYSGVAYTDALGSRSLTPNEYIYELAWQEDDSSDRDDLTLIHQEEIKIINEQVNFLVVAEDIQNPTILNYTMDIIDDDDDDVDDLFNLRVLNMHTKSEGLDVYMSDTDETFNEAVLVGSYAYQELSDNQKFDQDEYIFYITDAGQEEVLYKSQEISFPYSSQYIVSVRPFVSGDEATFVIDKISLSSITAYPDADADASYRVFNAISEHELLPTYSGSVDFFLSGIDDTPEAADLAQHEFSEKLTVAKNDYSVSLTVAGTDEVLLNNHLLTLPENSNKTIFFYLDEENVDEDGDGNVDEDGDGIVDEVEITINSLVVDNSIDQSIYDHQIKMINLVDNEDFSSIAFYFVRNDELIDTTPYKTTVSYGRSGEIDLVNNTYQVYAVASEDSSDIILSIEELVLDEDSGELFLVIEEDETTPSGYRLTYSNQ